MSSPLDGRIRALAREEATALLGVATPASTGPDTVAALQAEVAELRARLAAVEKKTEQADQEPRATVRRTRKTSSE